MSLSKKRKLDESGSACPYLAVTEHARQVSSAVSGAGLLGRLSSGFSGLLGFSTTEKVDSERTEAHESHGDEAETPGGGDGGQIGGATSTTSAVSTSNQKQSKVVRRKQSSTDDQRPTGDVSKCPFFNNQVSQLRPSSSHPAMSPSSGGRKTLLLTGVSPISCH